MEGDDWGCLEASGDFVDCFVLCNLEDVEDAFETTLSGVEGEAVCKDREDEGVEDAMPVSIVEAPDRVAKDTKAANGGTGVVSHNCGMMLPLEFVMDENTKVTDGIRTSDTVISKGVREADVSNDAPDVILRKVRGK